MLMMAQRQRLASHLFASPHFGRRTQMGEELSCGLCEAQSQPSGGAIIAPGSQAQANWLLARWPQIREAKERRRRRRRSKLIVASTGQLSLEQPPRVNRFLPRCSQRVIQFATSPTQIPLARLKVGHGQERRRRRSVVCVAAKAPSVSNSAAACVD